jgi:hypothetical protein
VDCSKDVGSIDNRSVSDRNLDLIRCFGFWERVKDAQMSAQIIQEWDGGFIVCELRGEKLLGGRLFTKYL